MRVLCSLGLSDGLSDGDLTTAGFTVAFCGSSGVTGAGLTGIGLTCGFSGTFDFFSGSFPGLTSGIFGFTLRPCLWALLFLHQMAKQQEPISSL